MRARIPSPLTSPEEARRLIAAGEGRQVEFKEGVAPDGRIARTICAFANTKGGLLVVGVSDRGRILGVGRPAAVIDRLAALARAVDPPVRACIEAVRLGDSRIVCCSVPLSGLRPHSVAGEGVLLRVGSSNRVASAAAIEEMGTPTSRRIVPDALEGGILRQIAAKGAGVTPEQVAGALGVGKQRVRQAIDRLEHAGLVVAHGFGPGRAYWVGEGPD